MSGLTDGLDKLYTNPSKVPLNRMIHFYIIFTPWSRLFTPFIHRKRYSSISTNKEVHMDLLYVSLAVALAAMAFGMAYAISRSNGRN